VSDSGLGLSWGYEEICDSMQMEEPFNLLCDVFFNFLCLGGPSVPPT
jgi:hypothetical protein